jgi:hypothetical protein
MWSHLRWIDHHRHSSLTVSGLWAVEPDRILILDGYGKHLVRNAGAWAEEAAEDSILLRWFAWVGEWRPSDSVAPRIEVEVNFVTSGCVDRSRTERQPVPSYVDIMGCSKSKDGQGCQEQTIGELHSLVNFPNGLQRVLKSVAKQQAWRLG